MTRSLTIGLAAVLGLSLAACQGKQADTGKAAAAAEVLPGSANDAMIAYDTLRSQPPIAVSTAADVDRGAGSGGSGTTVRSSAAASDVDGAEPSVEAVEPGQAASGAVR